MGVAVIVAAIPLYFRALQRAATILQRFCNDEAATMGCNDHFAPVFGFNTVHCGFR
jgi:hypothetical protein